MTRALAHLPVVTTLSMVVLPSIGVLCFGLPEVLILLSLAAIALCTIRWPGQTLVGLVLFLPFNGILSDLVIESGLETAAMLLGASKDVVIGALVSMAVARRKLRSVPRDLLIIVVLFLLLGAFSGLWSGSLQQAAYGWRNDFMPSVLVLVVPVFLTERVVKNVVRALIVSMTVASVVAFATWSRGVNWLYTSGQLPVSESQNFPGTFFVHGSDRPRAFSPFSGPNELGFAVAVLVAVVLCQGSWSWRRRLLVSIAPILAAVLSQSRSGLLGLVVTGIVVVVWLLWQQSRRIATQFMAAAAVVVAVGSAWYATRHFGENGDPSLGGHASSLESALRLISERPFGYGLGRVGPRSINYESDPILVESFWLLLALEAGVIALMLFIALLARLSWISVQGGSLASFTSFAVIAAGAVSQLVLPTLQDTSVASLFWIAISLGLFARADSIDRRGAPTPAVLPPA